MPLIPRKILFSDPQKSMPLVSPNGQWLAFLAPWSDDQHDQQALEQKELNVWIAPIDTLEKAYPISQSKQPIKEYVWSANSEFIFYFFDNGGDENWQFNSYCLTTQKTFSLTYPKCQSKIIHISTSHPDYILLGINLRDKQYHDVFKYSLNNNTLECIYENLRYWDFIADEKLCLRFGLLINQTTGNYIDLQSPQLTCVAQVNQHDLFHLYFYSRLKAKLATDGNTLFFIQSMHSETTQLMAYDIKSDQTTWLGGDEKADIYEIIYCPISKRPFAYSTYYTHKKWHVLQNPNDESKNALTFLTEYQQDELEISSQSADNSCWIVGFSSDKKGVQFYQFNKNLAVIKYLFESHPQLANYSLASMRAHVIKVRDGLECVSYLSRPHSHDDKPLPLVLKIHGGPNSRDCWGYNALHQWLANRGYAVLSINYRASTGFGKTHSLSGNGEWGDKIPKDILDAVNWALEQNITTRDKIAIFGQSFGGYQVLQALTQFPDTFCCGIDIVGFANVVMTLQRFPPYWKPLLDLVYYSAGGSPFDPTKKAYLTEISPLFQASNIRSPLFIAHGANDARIKQSESEEMVKALKKNNIPVIYALFPDEGHTIYHPGNKIALYALIEDFLARQLGGSSEPLESEVKTSMMLK